MGSRRELGLPAPVFKPGWEMGVGEKQSTDPRESWRVGGAQNQKLRSSGIRSGRGVGKVLQSTPGPDAGVPKARTWGRGDGGGK